MILLVIMILIIQKIKQDGRITKALKKKIMWSSFFRGQIQFYFPVALIVLMTLNQPKLNVDLFVTIFKLSLLLILPVFSYVYLKANFEKLEDEEFNDYYGTLY